MSEKETGEEFEPVDVETADGFVEDDTDAEGDGQYVGGPQDG